MQHNSKTLPNDIIIKYHNQTGDVDFDVMVYTKGHVPGSKHARSLAWKILRGQSTVVFTYTRQMQVGAQYFSNNQSISCGPITAWPGSTWEIIHENSSDTPVLRQGRLLTKCSNG